MDDEIVEQGTASYRDTIIYNMKKKAKESGDSELRKIVKLLEKAKKEGKLDYLEITQKVDKDKLKPFV